MKASTWRTLFIGLLSASVCIGNLLAEEPLSVKALPSIAIESGNPIPIFVSVGATTASGVKVGFVSLIEKQYKRTIAPTGLQLCKSASKPCSDVSLTLEANRSHDLWLWGASGAGVYEGTVSISSANKPAGEPPLQMTVYVSSMCAKFIGVVLIAVSVVGAFLFNVVLRNVLTRKQLLIPVSLVKEDLFRLRMAISRGPKRPAALFANTTKRIEDVEKSLNMEALENNGFPKILMSFASGASSDAFKTYFAKKSQLAQVLKIVVNEGLVPVRDFLLQTEATVPLDQAARDAVTDIENAARCSNGLPPGEDAVRQNTAAALQILRKAAGARGLDRSPDAVASSEQLRLEITSINLASWVLVLIATTAVGAFVLVLIGESALSFGSTADYVKCVLWGLGLPAGAQLASATTSTVATSFGVPKVG